MLIKHEQGNDLQMVKEHKLPRLVLMKPQKKFGEKSDECQALLKKAVSKLAMLEARLERERETRYQEGFKAGTCWIGVFRTWLRKKLRCMAECYALPC